MTREELDLVETEHLVAALMRRSKCLVLAFYQEIRGEAVGRTRTFRGGAKLAQPGLIRLLDMEWVREARASQEQGNTGGFET